jgi:ribosomal protein S18 acetylase RimI-like enzyme
LADIVCLHAKQEVEAFCRRSPFLHLYSIGDLDDFFWPQAVALSAADTEDLLALYAASYPGNWLVPRMLETGYYFGIRRGRALVSIAGVHVFSPHYKAAALGNITTRPDARGQGLATTATARLCQELLHTGIEYVGLNVKADNHGAIACYEKLGFERVTEYGEYTLQTKRDLRLERGTMCCSQRRPRC